MFSPGLCTCCKGRKKAQRKKASGLRICACPEAFLFMK